MLCAFCTAVRWRLDGIFSQHNSSVSHKPPTAAAATRNSNGGSAG